MERERSPLSCHHLVSELNEVGACTKCTSDQVNNGESIVCAEGNALRPQR